MTSSKQLLPGTVPLVPVIVGPTCSGKTIVALQLAELLGAEIISADSRQIYKYLDIGTAKPTPEQRSAVRHHFVDELTPDQPFSAGEFGINGSTVVEDIVRRKKTPLIVGGSGLYIRSLIDGLFEGPGADPELREILERKLKAGRIDDLIEQLWKVDPESAAKADPTKPRRIIRALEVYHLTGKPLSQHHQEGRPDIGFTAFMVGLNWERSELYRRIDSRCDEMLQAGLLGEIDHLEHLGYDRRLNALNTVGYAEGFAYRAGEVSYAEMLRLFKQNSRRYAKRQLSWFRPDRRIVWIVMEKGREPRSVVQEITEKFEAAVVGGN